MYSTVQIKLKAQGWKIENFLYNDSYMFSYERTPDTGGNITAENSMFDKGTFFSAMKPNEYNKLTQDL